MAPLQRWTFQVSPAVDRAVRQAAAAQRRTLEDFVVHAAVAEADRVLADRTAFSLPLEQWARFVEILDRSPQEKPELRALFARPSLFTE